MSSASYEEGASSLWEELLKQYVGNDNPERHDCNVVVLGNQSSGVRSLLARMAGKDIDDAYQGFALEYETFDISNPDDRNDSSYRINLWHLETPDHSDLLKVALPPDALGHSLVVLVTDLSNPTTVMEHVDSWSDKLREHVRECMEEKTPAEKAELEDKVLQHLAQVQKELKDKQQNAQDAKPPKRRRQRSASLFSKQMNAIKQEETIMNGQKQADAELLTAEMAPGLLTNNFGLPIVVVGTKSDLMVDATKAACKDLNSSEANARHLLNFMQAHLRTWCLANGASLVFTSAKMDTGIDTLMDYIKSRAFGFPFEQELMTTNPENVFVPFGFDSLERIGLLNFEPIATLDTPYNYVLYNHIKNKDRGGGAGRGPGTPSQGAGGRKPGEGGTAAAKCWQNVVRSKLLLTAAGVNAFQSAGTVPAMDHQSFLLGRRVDIERVREQARTTFRDFIRPELQKKRNVDPAKQAQREEIWRQIEAEEKRKQQQNKTNAMNHSPLRTGERGKLARSMPTDTTEATNFFTEMIKRCDSFKTEVARSAPGC
eukprot:TRINITY_DN66525_c7_g10_i1.p1 TRINITY_DN66525_c7_g10~~TRINITY_DN66525_c7_g10_i1.p1  ORF type:complete len:542 (+),score=80.43 TRINITY_DN66525_c7_g10_i1:61-1686(+)